MVYLILFYFILFKLVIFGRDVTPPTPSFPIALNHGRLEAWFEGHEDRIQTFLIEIIRKQIILSKVIRMSWMKAENFDTLEQHLKAKTIEDIS